jgi:stage V sporulation protein AC
MSLIFISSFLTALNVFNRIGKFAGAGSLIPITGFANSIVSPAMEYKSEGYVMGVGAKMFTVAGPVLVYGISTSIIVRSDITNVLTFANGDVPFWQKFDTRDVPFWQLFDIKDSTTNN